MKIGCNYWASNAGTRMWKDWDEQTVRDDFRRMAEAGMQVVRDFPNWQDFQPLEMVRKWANLDAELLLHGRPLPDTPCGRDGIDENQLQRLRLLCDIAHENGLQLIVGLVTGWMSGVMFLPPAFQERNPITDPLLLKWETRYVRRLVLELRDKPAIILWELGNECNCMGQVKSEAQAWNWTWMLTSAIRLADPSRPVSSGMHSLMAGADAEFDAPAWPCRQQGELCDLLTAHPCPHTTSKAPARLDRHTSVRLAFQATIEIRQYADLAQRPAFVEELGTFSSSYCDEQTKAAFVTNSMLNAWAHGSDYYLWWCAFEHSQLPFPPYTWSTWERELGMFDENLRLRPVGNALADFRRFLDALPLDHLPPFRRNAVCVLTREQDFRAFTNNTWSAFLLAKLAGFDLEFQWIGDPLRPADLYLVPGIRGTNWSRSHEFRALLDAARNGATLYLSLDGGDIAPFSPDVFGASVLSRETRDNPNVAFSADGQDFSIAAPYRLILQPTTADVLAREPDGNPVLIHSRHGQGDIFLLTLPLEQHLSTRPRAFDAPDASPWERLYRLIAHQALAQRAAIRDCRLVTLTEHPIDDRTCWLVAVNNSSQPQTPRLTPAPGWRFSQNPPAIIPPHHAALCQLTRNDD